jgi:hypothetical protein
MGHQVHRAVRAVGADHRFEVVGQVHQAVVPHPPGGFGVTGAAHVVGDDPVVGGQFAHQRQPDPVVVGVAVHQQQHRALGVAPLVGGQAHAIALDEGALGFEVERCVHGRAPGREVGLGHES